ncbi:peptidase [Pedobacter sp. HMF7647]|uniref:Peptidase n=1 Tax=Hufsiella arboris TaxID=2695275 RepID=A0A7K1YC25_9SPHI|nr:M90 family metallopeptidase [Hufsiella arboris]MXV52136.1 peptidase [Hufsiella arboris]
MIYLICAAVLIIFIIVYLRSGKPGKPVTEKELTEIKLLLETFVGFYQKLGADKKAIFEQKIVTFLSHTKIEAIGTEIEELDKVLVAASAVIPIFGFPDWRYHNLTNVILYPDVFDKEFQYEGSGRNTMGMVGEGYMNGQMILSKSSLRAGFINKDDKQNTGVHEFVHLLDKSDGTVDGVPEILLSHSYTIPWLKMVHHEMKDIEKGKSDINPYAAENEGEFLAVVSEYFFERSELLESRHPELYKMLNGMFHPG